MYYHFLMGLITAIFVKTHIYFITKSTWPQHQTLDSIQINGVLKHAPWLRLQNNIQIGPQTWNLLPHDIYMRNSLLLYCAGFSSGFKQYTFYFHPCSYGAAYSFNELDRVMGCTRAATSDLRNKSVLIILN